MQHGGLQQGHPLGQLVSGSGWLVLVGGGEFSFGETAAADRAWVDKLPPTGPVAFIPAASGSADYGQHFAAYLGEDFARPVEIVPIFRGRDARRGRNAERLTAAAGVYLGGGIPDHLLDALAGSPAAAALRERWLGGGVVVAIAAAAQTVGAVARSVFGGGALAGLQWLPGVAIEPNFDPGHDRRLRRLLARPEVTMGVGLPAGSALLLGPSGRVEVVGTLFTLTDADDDLTVATADDFPVPPSP